MRILYIYRHPDMGFSIGKVFRPIENEMRRYADVDTVYMPVSNYKPKGLWHNIKAARTAVKKTHYDIVHITGTEHYLLPFLRSQNTVVTVHDLGFFTNQRVSVRSLWKYLSFIKTLQFAKRVTFISEKTQRECERFLHFKKGQAKTIFNPVGEEFTYVPKEFNALKPVILHVGTKQNKNLDNSIIALQGMNCHLRIVGKLDGKHEVLLRLYNVDYSCAHDLTDEEILNEYRNCDIVNFPSFYEGFGMPIIEGNGVGRVVVTSNISPMQDVANNSCVIVDPTSVESIRKGYEEAIKHHESYIQRGLDNVRRYELGKITRDYLELYKTMQ